MAAATAFAASASRSPGGLGGSAFRPTLPAVGADAALRRPRGQPGRPLGRGVQPDVAHARQAGLREGPVLLRHVDVRLEPERQLLALVRGLDRLGVNCASSATKLIRAATGRSGKASSTMRASAPIATRPRRAPAGRRSCTSRPGRSGSGRDRRLPAPRRAPRGGTGSGRCAARAGRCPRSGPGSGRPWRAPPRWQPPTPPAAPSPPAARTPPPAGGCAPRRPDPRTRCARSAGAPPARRTSGRSRARSSTGPAGRRRSAGAPRRGAAPPRPGRGRLDLAGVHPGQQVPRLHLVALAHANLGQAPGELRGDDHLGASVRPLLRAKPAAPRGCRRGSATRPGPRGLPGRGGRERSARGA